MDTPSSPKNSALTARRSAHQLGGLRHDSAPRSSTLIKLEALRSCVHACDLGSAFLNWARALSGPPKLRRHTNSDAHLGQRTTLQLLEALRLVVLHEPLGRVHHALRFWHELSNVGRGHRAALRELNSRARPPEVAPTATRRRRSPPLGAEKRVALVSVTADDLHALMESVTDLREQLVRGPAPLAHCWVASITRVRPA